LRIVGVLGVRRGRLGSAGGVPRDDRALALQFVRHHGSTLPFDPQVSRRSETGGRCNEAAGRGRKRKRKRKRERKKRERKRKRKRRGGAEES
jgi:hypothetical protein